MECWRTTRCEAGANHRGMDRKRANGLKAFSVASPGSPRDDWRRGWARKENWAFNTAETKRSSATPEKPNIRVGVPEGVFNAPVLSAYRGRKAGKRADAKKGPSLAMPTGPTSCGRFIWPICGGVARSRNFIRPKTRTSVRDKFLNGPDGKTSVG